MVRATLEDGLIHPRDTLPAHWINSQELVIDEAAGRPSPEELESWSREMDALANAIPPEDFERVELALADAHREAKA